MLKVPSPPADSLNFRAIGNCLYISSNGEAENRIGKPVSRYCDLKDVIDGLRPMSLCFAVEKRCSSTFAHKSITSSSA